MFQKIKKIMAGVLAAGMIFALTGCSSSESTSVSEVRIAYFPNITHTQALVMKNQKTLKISGKKPAK